MNRAAVLAAGGVLWRRDDLNPEVALFHRPKYDDWSLPKGKAEPGDALRQWPSSWGAAPVATQDHSPPHSPQPSRPCWQCQRCSVGQRHERVRSRSRGHGQRTRCWRLHVLASLDSVGPHAVSAPA